jgi:hypothetical protein
MPNVQEVPSPLGPVGATQPDPSNVRELPQPELPIRSQQETEPLKIDFNRLLDLVAQVESGNNPKVGRGKAGEIGVFQIKPSLAAHYGYNAAQLADPVQERALATTILAQYARKYHGNLAKTISAWNAGEPRTDRGIIPLSTHNYINKVIHLYKSMDGTAYAAEPPGGKPPSATVGKVGGMLDFHDYTSYDQLAHDWEHTRSYNALPFAKRQRSLELLRQKWDEEQANKPDPTAGIVGSDSNLDFTGRLNKEASDYMTNLAGGPNTFAGQVAGGATKLVLPSTNTQALIDMGLFATGAGPEIKAVSELVELAPETVQPLARLAGRLSGPTLGGAVGGTVSGQGTGRGAVQGAATGLTNEATQWGFRAGKYGIQRLDLGRIGGWLEDQVGVKLPSRARSITGKGGDLLEAFRGTRATDVTDARLDLANGRVVRALLRKGGGLGVGGAQARKALSQDTFNVSVAPDLAANPAFIKSVGLPPGVQPMSFKQASSTLDQVEQIGWSSEFRLQKPRAAQAARSGAIQMERDIYQGISKVDHKVAEEWLNARKAQRAARVFSNLFRMPGVVKEDNSIDISRLQELAFTKGPKGFKDDIEQSVGPREAAQFENLLQRGGRSGATDVKGRGPFANVRMHLGVLPYGHPQIPHPSKHVGYIPYELGRGRVLFAATALGATKFVDRLTQMFGEDSDRGEPNASASQQ